MAVAAVDGAVVAVAIGANTSAAPAPTLHRTDLPNGLTVLSESVPGARSGAFGAWVRAATLHERPEQMGVSHLLEHRNGRAIIIHRNTVSRYGSHVTA